MPFCSMDCQEESSVDDRNVFTSFPCPVEFPDGAVFFSPALGRQAGITVHLWETSLTRVLGSVTLAMDKARKGAWSAEGKGSAAHVRGKPG